MAHIGSSERNFRTDKLIWTDELNLIYGLEPQSKDIYFQDFLKLIHPEDSLMVQQTINKCALNHRPYSITFRIILRDGTERIRRPASVNTLEIGNEIGVSFPKDKIFFLEEESGKVI